MTSPKQLAANRENAKNSTGPQSAEGKACSSQNAITHGLNAQRIVIPGEDPDIFEALRQSLFGCYRPQPGLETVWVETLAGLLWRALRIPALEALVLKALQQDEIDSRGRDELGRERDNRPRINYDSPETVELKSSANFLKTLRDVERRREQQFGRQAGVHIGHALIRDARYHDVLAKLERHEVHLLNGIERVLRLLETDRAKREKPRKVDGDIIDVEPDAA